jgi:hypothetical protein
VNLTTSPSRIDIIIHNADAEWWQIVAALGPLVVILSAVLIAAIGWLTLRRRTVADAVVFGSATTIADSQSDWWHRAGWALEASLDDDPARREAGLAALQLLNESSLSGKEETLVIAEAWKSPLRDARTMSAFTEKKPVDVSDPQGSISPEEERVVVRAARLRRSTDKKQGIESPSWVKEIAKQPL